MIVSGMVTIEYSLSPDGGGDSRNLGQLDALLGFGETWQRRHCGGDQAFGQMMASLEDGQTMRNESIGVLRPLGVRQYLIDVRMQANIVQLHVVVGVEHILPAFASVRSVANDQIVVVLVEVATSLVANYD